MPTFKLKIFNTNAELKQQNIVISRQRMLDILITLQDQLKEDGNVDDDFLQLLTSLIKLGDESVLMFQKDAVDIQLHPEIWSKTNRIAASTLVLDGRDKLNIPESSFSVIRKLLTEKLKKLSRFNKNEKAQIKLIDTALRALEEFQEDANLIYMESLRKETASGLLDKLTTYNGIDHDELYRRLVEELTKLKNYNAISMLTSTAALEFSKSITLLRDDLINFHTRTSCTDATDDFIHLANQLSILGKREADYHYNHPKEMTRLDRWRAFAKAIAASIGFVCGVSAFVCAFIPGVQVASVPLAIIATLGMVPVLDKTWEVFRNLWHKRSPTKAQVIELGIIYPCMVFFILLTHAMPAIAAAILGNSAKIIPALENFANILSTRVLAEIAGFVYLGRTIIAGREIHKGNEPRTQERIHQKSIIPLKRGIEQFHNHQIKLEDKNTVNIRKAELLLDLKKEKASAGYIYKGKKNNDRVNKIHFSASHYKDIKSCHSRLFSKPLSKDIDKTITAYTKLPADELPETRMKALEEIQIQIAKHPHQTNNKLIELKTWVRDEKATLESIRKSMQTEDDIDNNRIYLTN